MATSSRVRFAGQAAAETPFIRSHAPQINLPMFNDAAASFFSLQSDRDGVLRWMPLIIQGGDDLYRPLGLLCAWHYLDRPPMTVHVASHGVDRSRSASGWSRPTGPAGC